MADKAEKKPEEKAAAPAEGGHGADAKGKGGGLLKSMPVLFGAVMIIEAIVLFAGFKFLGGSPKQAHGDTTLTEDHGEKGGDGHGDGHGDGGAKVDKKKLVELSVLEFRAPNKLSGKLFLYDVAIYVSTKGDHKEALEKSLKDREATIRDRIRTIISQSDPEKLGGGSEPGLETLRRQVKHQLEEIVGEGKIEEVLIPRCIPFRAEF